jgi:hypothetical protein
MITDMLFAQYQPAPGETRDLYLVPDGSSARGTVYISAHAGFDIVSVALIPRDTTADPKNYIMRETPLVGNVPIYLQQLYLNHGDRIQISSVRGDSSFTFTGERYS